MSLIQHSILIRRSQAEVFGFVTSFENDHRWWKALTSTEKLTPGDISVGTEFRQAAKVIGLIPIYNVLKVVEYAPPDYVRYMNESPQLSYRLLYKFEPVDDGTVFHLEADLEAKGLLKWIFPLLYRSLKSELESYFKLLKTVMESEA